MSNGTSKLSAEQQDWFLAHHNLRYLHVQTNAGVPSRGQRRAARRQQRRRPDGKPYGG